MEIGEVSFYGLMPVIIFAASICLLTLIRSLNRTNSYFHRVVGAEMTIAASILTIIIAAARWRQFDIGKLNTKDTTTLSGLVSTDRLSAIAIIVISLILIIVSLVSYSYLRERQDIPAAEFFILLQCVALGMFAMAMANDLLSMFVALEVFSIPLYVLTAFDRRRVRSLEGGFKYFILGAVSSAIFLYGIALHYGVSGSTALGPATEITTTSAIACVLILIGLLFKVAAVPFHFWSPDAYQGAPTPVTALMSACTKLIAFVALARLISTGVIDSGGSGVAGRTVLTFACIGSAVFGSVVALRQTNMKRAMAYSSISHTAYMLLALKASTEESLQAVMTYAVIYAFMIAGTFIIIGVIAGVNEQGDALGRLKGLARTNPYLAGSLTILLLAQAGMPLTSGFIAKFDVFRIAFAEDFYITGLIVLITTVIAAALYLRIVLSLYTDSFSHAEVDSANAAYPPETLAERSNLQMQEKLIVPVQVTISVAVCVIITLAIGFLPSLITGFTHIL